MNNSVYDLSFYKKSLFIPDYRNNKVFQYSISSKISLNSFEVNSPHGISIDKEGHIYSCNYKSNSITIIKDGIKKTRSSSLFNFPLSSLTIGGKSYIANWGDDLSGNLIYTDDRFKSFKEFVKPKKHFKPHSIKSNDSDHILVVYRKSPAMVVYDINGLVIKEKLFPKNFDPLSVLEYKSIYLIPNYFDGNIYIYSKNLDYKKKIDGGGNYPTNLTLHNNTIYVSEEKGNRILFMDFKKIEQF